MQPVTTALLMEFAAGRFARRVLLGHLALLCLVLIAVAVAARYLYSGARQQVIGQAEKTQTLLARQTAAGVESFYESITNVLNLLQPSENDPATRPFREPISRPGRRVGEPFKRLAPPEQQQRRRNLEAGPLAGAFNRLATAVWEQIKDKCTTMFLVDPLDGMAIVRVIGADPDAPAAEEIVKQASAWLAEERGKKSISPFYPNLGGGAHLVCVPMRGPNNLLMVALVPIGSVERDLLAAVNRSSSTGSSLVDERGTYVSAFYPGLRGKNLEQISDPRIREMARALRTGRAHGITQTFEDPINIGDVQTKPAMASIEPIEVLGDKRWFLIIASNLSEVDDVVRPIFRDALVWAIVVMIAVMGILTSTAVQMIRSRLKLERAQMEIINREMTQAREIQLNWLPDQPASLRGIDIAAVNTPASHVSGDFYNWFELPDGRIAVIIGDVTGHGMAAAFLMATTQLLVRTNLPRCGDPGSCMTEVNRQLCTQIFSGQFVTMQILLIDLARGHIDIATAGHPAPISCENGQVQDLQMEPQLVLGIEESIQYPTERFALSAISSLLLYTDGLPDAESPEGSRFTASKIRSTLKGQSTSARQMVEALVKSVDRFRLGRDLGDDVTLVAVRLEAQNAVAVSLGAQQ